MYVHISLLVRVVIYLYIYFIFVSISSLAMLMYNQLIKSNDYTFDDSMIPSLNIPDMTAPPPLPPKKRKKRPEPARKPETKRDTSPLVNVSGMGTNLE